VSQYKLVSFGPTTQAGNFTVSHGLGRVPNGFEILRSTFHFVGVQSPDRDAGNIYLTCSAPGAAGKLRVW
jgi:hypothetical protein